MVDYTKPQPCGDCGKMVIMKERHTFEDCRRWESEIKIKMGCEHNYEYKGRSGNLHADIIRCTSCSDEQLVREKPA